MKQLYLVGLLLFLAGCHYVKSPEMRMCTRLDWQSVIDFFPKSPKECDKIAQESILLMDEMLKTLQAIPCKQRTFHNTVRLYDNAKFKFIMNLQILSTLAMLSDDNSMKLAANKAVVKLQRYQDKKLSRNRIILDSFQDYARYGTDDNSKTASVRSFLQKTIDRLEHDGAKLNAQDMITLHALTNEIADLQGQFCSMLHNHGRSIMVKQKDLTGTNTSWISQLEKAGNDYILPLNIEAFFEILENCTCVQTREKFFLAFGQRAYPENLDTLKKLLAKRSELAQLVGYKNFAAYECSLQMIGSVDHAKEFIIDIAEQANKIVAESYKNLIRELPESVDLSSSGKLQPWDEAFVKSAYRKKHFDLDSRVLAEYFPLDHVMKSLAKEFGQFFALSFEPIASVGLWAPDLICWQVRLLKKNEIIGYLVFDLFARPGKAEQEAQVTVIPTIQDDCNLVCSGLTTIVTNFVKNKKGVTLLDFHEVTTLLHEFGHALHELFGATEFVDISGTQGPRDFLETPSQLFELWMTHPVMIKKFSHHYSSGAQLSDAMIDKIIKAENFGKASLLQRQALLSMISLEFGCSDGSQDLHAMVGKIYQDIRIDVQYDPKDYFETGFEHLVGYGSHYYGYVWSQVLAYELFDYICKHGITNMHVGKRLYELLLSHGGSQDPHSLIELVLGTSVSKKALLHSLEK